MAIVWDENRQSFIEKGTNRILSNRKVLDLLDKTILQGFADLEEIAKAIVNGEITLESFIDQASAVLKNMHLAQAIKAKGGENLTVENLKTVSTILDQEFLHGFDPETGNKFGLIHLADDILAGNVTEAQLINRLGMYGDSSRKSGIAVDFQDKKADPDYKLCLNILNKVKTNHHPLCIEATAKGWITLDEMEAYGLPQRHPRCHCTIVYK